MPLDLPDFDPAPGGVDPAAVPARTLASGATIPAIGLGTFGSDHVTHAEVARAVFGAARVGYRHFDCAAVYGNENLIGEALAKIQAGGVAREELWITSKLWNDKHGPGEVRPACEQTLRDLQLDYLDLYLVHWPFPNSHPPGCDGATRDPDARPYVHAEYMETWRQMEALVDDGLVRHVGTSNMTVPKLELLLRDARVKPACNEMELHPHFQQPEFFQYLVGRDIQPIGYSPIGSPKRPPRDTRPDDTAPIEDPVIREIAGRMGVHPAVVCVKWAVQRGQVPIPFTTHERKYLSNLRATVQDPLTADDMAAIAGVDQNCRLIKGQVFLWESARDWRDLWDVNGTIPGV